MTISIHIDKALEKTLHQHLLQYSIPLSEFIRDAIREKLSREETAPNPYELGKDLFGRYGSGRDDLSTNRKALLQEKLRAKHRH